MKPISTVFAVLLCAGSSANALAAATPEGAARITAALQAYVGAEPGVVTVTPSGDTYDLRLDAGPLFAKIQEPGVQVTLTPLLMTLTDQGGGRWKVDQDQPLSFSFKVEGTVDMQVSLASLRGTGIFDESLGAFASTSSQISQLALLQAITESGATTRVAYTIGAIKSESTASAGANGVDSRATYNFTDLKETISTPAAPDGSMPTLDLTVTSPSGVQDANVKGLRVKQVSELAAFLVANPSAEMIKANQAELKDKLRAAIPVWDTVDGTAVIDQLSVNSAIGRFGLSKADIYVSMNGVVDQGALREKFTLTGLQMPEGIVPAWASGLVPNDLTFDINVSGFNLAAPAKLLIDTMDLTQDPPSGPEFEQKMLSAFLPTLAVNVGLGPSELISAIYRLKAEGALTMGPGSAPLGQATIAMKGLDDVMAALQAAPPEMGMQQVAPVGIVAKGMAKQGADGELTWKIEMTPAGAILVNGTDVTAMGGGQ